MKQLYGIYAFVRDGTGLPKVVLMTASGSWTQSPEGAGRWRSRRKVVDVITEAVIDKDFKNVWWFTWDRSDLVRCKSTVPEDYMTDGPWQG